MKKKISKISKIYVNFSSIITNSAKKSTVARGRNYALVQFSHIINLHIVEFLNLHFSCLNKLPYVIKPTGTF